jgi:hypothetical protein
VKVEGSAGGIEGRIELAFYNFATNMKGQPGGEIQIKFDCAKSSATFSTALIIIEKMRTELGLGIGCFWPKNNHRDLAALGFLCCYTVGRRSRISLT